MSQAHFILALADVSALADTLLRWLVMSILYGTLLALVTWVVLKTAFRRAGLLFAGAIWTVVLLKFVVPAGPAIPYSLSSLLQDTGHRIGLVSNSPQPTGAPGETPSIQYITIFEQEAATVTGAAEPSEDISKPASFSWALIIALVYFVTVLGITLLRAARYFQMARLCRRLPVADAETLTLVRHTCARHGLTRVPDVRISDEATAPFVIGLMRPLLVLSTRNLASPDETEAVVLHEIGHLRLVDVFVRCLQCLVGTLLFFWPVVAWVNRRIDLAREHACDDWALSHGRLSAAEYARCLLRAMQPVRSTWTLYHPAAMAANKNHVERRIEMILQHSKSRRHARNLGVGALVTVAAWAIFTLSGSTVVDAAVAPGEGATSDAAKQVVVTKVNELKDGQIKVKVVRLSTDDLNTNPDAANATAKLALPAGDVKVHAFAVSPHVIKLDGVMTKGMICGIDEDSLAQFAKDHPLADIDADGRVSGVEREAYLAALAMNAPAAVIQKYPDADRNTDGRIDAEEAASLVTGGIFNFKLDGGAPRVIAFKADADGTLAELPDAPKILRTIVKTDSENAAEEIELKVDFDVEVKVEGEEADGQTVVVRAVTSDAAEAPEGELKFKTVDVGAMDILTEMHAITEADAGVWLLANVNVAPSADTLRAALTAVEAAPLARFMEWHPEADTDQDGKISAAERDEFMAAEMKNVRSLILEHIPEADADQNGELTEEEMQTYFENRSAAAATANGPEARAIVIGAQPEGAQIKVQPVQTRVIVKTVVRESEPEAETPAP